MTNPALLGHLADPDQLTITPERDGNWPDHIVFDEAKVRDICAACGHGKHGPAGHCPTDGCLVNAGTADECPCARYVADIPACPHCGAMYSVRWRLQNHLLPTPTCQSGARAAAGKFAEPVKVGPPLAKGRR